MAVRSLNLNGCLTSTKSESNQRPKKLGAFQRDYALVGPKDCCVDAASCILFPSKSAVHGSRSREEWLKTSNLTPDTFYAQGGTGAGRALGQQQWRQLSARVWKTSTLCLDVP